MPRDLGQPPADNAVTAAAGRDAQARDGDGAFPFEAFAALEKLGLTTAPPLACEDIGLLLAHLSAIGRGDLSVGRIFEGHGNALLLIDLFGTAGQRSEARRLVGSGALLGTWNTDHPEDPVRIEGARLAGRKSFASGAGGLSHALVTAETDDGRVMVLVALEGRPVDHGWWHPMGMRASCSHVVDLNGAPVTSDTLIGRPGDYLRQPWLTAGAIRFAAVQAGGMHALLDIVVAHLSETRRLDQPYQQHRIGRMAMAVQSAYGWLGEAAVAWRAGCPRPASVEAAWSDAALAAVATALATRMAIEREALALLEDAERSVGAAGLIAPHPLERVMRDLRTYLRQPNPDEALAHLGEAVGRGSWAPRNRSAEA